MKKVSIGKVIVSLAAVVIAYIFFEYALLVCTPSIPKVCKPQFSYLFNVFFGLVIGVITYLVYGLFQKR